MQLQQTSENLKEPLVTASDHEDDYAEYYEPNEIQTIDHHPQQYVEQQAPYQEQYNPYGNQAMMYNLPQPIGYPQMDQYNQQQQMPPIQQVYVPQSNVPQASSVPNSEFSVDNQGRTIMKTPTNYFAWSFLIIGLFFLWFPFVGIPFIIIGLISRNTEFIFDDRKRELTSECSGAIVKFGCLNRQVTVPYSSISDVVTEMDFSVRVNGVPSGKIIVVTSSGNVKLTKGYLNYYKATEMARKIMNFINQRRVQY